MAQQGAWVLHVAAACDDAALETLCHTTRTLGDLGVPQVVLALDESPGHELLWSAALTGEVHGVRAGSAPGGMASLGGAMRRLCAERPLHAVHLHGLRPCLLGTRALNGSLPQARVLYSPYLRELAKPWAPALLRGCLNARPGAALVASLTEAAGLSRLLRRTAEVLPYPVGTVFFAVPRREAPRPLVVADGPSQAAVDTVARLSVLLNGRAPRVPFAWIGHAAPRARAQLEAASVRILNPADDRERAALLARAWMFVHISTSERLPVPVAQAMAAGAPCVVSDTASHRTLIRHGENGLVCASEHDLVDKMVELMREPQERARIGQAGRAEAARCFSAPRFARAVQRAYGFRLGRPADAGPAGLTVHT